MSMSDNFCNKIKEFKNSFKVLPVYELKTKLKSEDLEKEASIAIRELIDERRSAKPVPMEVREAFLSEERIEGILYHLNQRVEIKEQQLTGKFGYIISIVGIEPEPTYLVELEEDGRDIVIIQSKIQMVEQK